MEHRSNSGAARQCKGEVFAPAALVNYAEGAVVSRTIVENGGGTVTLFAFDKGEGLMHWSTCSTARSESPSEANRTI